MKRGEIDGRDRFYLEQLHIGELEDDSVLARLDEQDRAEVERELSEEDEHLFARIPPQQFAETVNEKIEKIDAKDAGLGSRAAAPLKDRLLGGVRELFRASARPAVINRYLPLAAAALIVVAVGIAGLGGSLRNGDGAAAADVERVKGLQPVINIYRAEEHGVHLLGQRARARQNDLLQLEYNGAGYPYGVILSIDGRGTVTLHYPAGTGGIPVLEEGRVLLPYAYQLDDAPVFERFFFVTAENRFDTRRVLQAARKLADERDGGRQGALPLSGEFAQTSMMILKENR
jgi:hypothetical protein